MSTALPSLAKSELMAIEPAGARLLGRQLDLEQIFAALVADRVALAAAIAEFAEIAVDRDLRLLALLGARDDVEDRLLAGDLLQHALADVEDHGRAVGPERMRRKEPDSSSLTSAVAPVGALTARRIVRRKHRDPVARRLRVAGSPAAARASSAGSKSSLLDDLRRVGTAFAPGSLNRPVW